MRGMRSVLAIANTAAAILLAGAFLVTSPTTAVAVVDACDEESDEVTGCDCLYGGYPWLPDGCYDNASEGFVCETGGGAC